MHHNSNVIVGGICLIVAIILIRIIVVKGREKKQEDIYKKIDGLFYAHPVLSIFTLLLLVTTAVCFFFPDKLPTLG